MRVDCKQKFGCMYFLYGIIIGDNVNYYDRIRILIRFCLCFLFDWKGNFLFFYEDYNMYKFYL